MEVEETLRLIEDQLEQAKRLNAIGGAKDATPLEFLQAVYCNEGLPLHTRLKAAVEACPYVHPSLKATAIVPMGSDFAARLEKAVERSHPKLIEAKHCRNEG